MKIINRASRYIPGKAFLWLKIFFLGALYFAFFRLIFLLTHRDLLTDAGISNLVGSFLVGFRFDAVVLSVIILPLYLLTLLPFVNFERRLTRIVTNSFLVVIFSISFLISTVDLRFFDVFGSRINYWAVEYIEYPELFLYSSAGDSFSVELTLLWLFCVISCYIIIRNILKRSGGHRTSLGIIGRVGVYFLVALLLAFGIRGRFGIKPLDWGSAFFCDNHIVNQMSLNGVYTLSHSIYEEWRNGRVILGKNIKRFDFYEDREAYVTTAEMLGLSDSTINDNFNLTRSNFGEPKFDFSPNIVIIIMESWSAGYIGALGSDLNITPEFDRLCSNGILFNDFYANGVRTNRGIPAVLCSFPSLPGRSIMKRYAADYPFRSIAQILEKKNYSSIFAYGGDIEFDNMRGFLRSVGYDDFYDEDYFGSENSLGKWGVPDHIVFDQLAEQIGLLPRPFNLSILTLSNHEPYLIPDDRFRLYDDTIPDARLYNCFYYSDWALGQFMRKMEKLPLFDSTIFIFTADHCSHQSSQYLLDPQRFHTPFLVYGPALLDAGDSAIVIEKTGSQVDILPTLLGILGDASLHSSWGRDLTALKTEESGFAVIVLGEKFGLIEGDRFFIHWPKAVELMYDLDDSLYLERNLIGEFPEQAEEMKRRLDSYIQTANYLSRGDKLK